MSAPNGLISVTDALSKIEAHRPSRETETVALEAALGRQLSAPIIAQRTHPPEAMSAMDGYAVRLEDVREANARLLIIGEAPAGSPFERDLRAGEAVRIFTGSVIPNGADHVVIQENVIREDAHIIVSDAYQSSSHIRPAGIDFKQGDLLIPAEERLRPVHLSVIAASNHASISAYRQLNVGLISNGDELRPPGSKLGPGEIINSNPYTLAALIREWGGNPVHLGIAGDCIEDIFTRIDSNPEIDVFVPVGGASVGDHDHMQSAFGARGFATVFSKIAVRPGKPTWFSKSEDSVVLGLPGNPASALVCAHLFLAPLMGVSWSERLTVGKLTTAISENGPREHFVRSRATLGADGTISIAPYRNQDSSLLHPFLSCNTLLRREPGASALAEGAQAEVLLIGAL
jgi:molybdopterin molybdotransferase